MININKKNMTTTAIGIILFSTLFSLLNVDREMEQVQIDEPDEIVIHQETKIKEEVIKKPEVKKEIPQPKVVEVKKEIKEEPSGPQVLYYNGKPDYAQFYSINNTDERIANAEYIVRDDYYVPNTIEPFDDEKPYIPALLGEIANEYSIYYESAFEDGEQKVNELENMLGYKIIDYDIDGYNAYINITLELPTKTAQEVENVKEVLKQMYLNKDIDDFFVNSGPLPEYTSEKYIDIWRKSGQL